MRRAPLVPIATAVLWCATSFCPSLARADDARLPALEPAPRIEMREFRPYGGTGTASITGTVVAPTKIFGNRSMYGAKIYLIPDTSYSLYVEHQYRDAWLNNTTHAIDRGVAAFIKTFVDGKVDTFTFEHVMPGRYLVFAGIADSAATSTAPCTANYRGFDANGNVVDVPVPVYCYGGVHRDIMFLSGAVTVAAGERAVVTLEADGEVTS